MKALMAILIGLALGLGLSAGMGQVHGAPVAAASAAAAGYSLSDWTVDGGGGWIGVGPYLLGGTIGQADAGDLSQGGYTLQGGFWPGGGVRGSVFIPVVSR